MKKSNARWREQVVGAISDGLRDEIDQFETEIELRRQGKIDEKVFAETRLRRGVYGQRYDNGQRHDGVKTQTLSYPSGDLVKGPGTVWDAPGMLRIKIPFGGMNTRQLEVLAELAEEYSEGIAHVTTRQDFQLHFIHIEDAPTIMRRLGAAGITTREACGNSVRNVTACPIAGVCQGEAFDVTPYAHALSQFLLGHPDAQDFGRKVKIAFSGCREEACGLTNMHDIGAIAVTRVIDGEEKRGFEFYVGGGLGAVPFQAKLFDEFLPEEELLPISQAIAIVFAKYGEKRNRARARIKFLVKKLGIDELRKRVLEERAGLTPDPAWTAYLDDLHITDETPFRFAHFLNGATTPEGFDGWQETNVYYQRQGGYVTVTIALPLGDITADQLRGLADLTRKYVNETIRTTVEQNMVLRWVSEADLIDLYNGLKDIELAEAGAGTIVDITSCPGTDTCKLGIASSRGLSGELRIRLAEKSMRMDEAIKHLRIKVSGCFNSCGQHHVADLGFYGVSRHIGGYTVPHFQVILGGQWTENGGSYGLAVGAIPSRRIPEVVDRITGRYLEDRQTGESFQDFIKRIGKINIKTMLEDLVDVPAYHENAEFYSDWGDPREFTTGDMGTGECAGEVITQVEFALAAAEREAFEAQVLLDKGEVQTAGERAYHAMIRAAQGLTRIRVPKLDDDNERIVEAFRAHLFDTETFFDPFGGGRFGQYLFSAHSRDGERYTEESAHHRIEETQLFIEASYSCYARLQSAPQPAAG